MICVPLTKKGTEATLANLNRAAEVADLVELRLDCIEEYDLSRLMRERPCPVIVTNRPVREGGSFNGDEKERVRPLKEAINLGADYVDIEHDSSHLIEDRKKTKLIVSYHNFQETPSDLLSIYTRLKKLGADIVKVTVWAQNALDNLVVFDVLKSSEIPSIGLCMGEAGLMSRVLAPKFDAFLTFASLEQGGESGPGQITLGKMNELYRTNMIDSETKIYGLLGDSLDESPLISAFNTAFYESGFNARCLPFSPNGDLKMLLESFKSIGVEGYIVLQPYQEPALAAVDVIHSSAELARKVNTVVNRDGRLEGWEIDGKNLWEITVAQFNLWTGLDAPVDSIKGTLK